jgi:hypothetical protein
MEPAYAKYLGGRHCENTKVVKTHIIPLSWRFIMLNDVENLILFSESLVKKNFGSVLAK